MPFSRGNRYQNTTVLKFQPIGPSCVGAMRKGTDTGTPLSWRCKGLNRSEQFCHERGDRLACSCYKSKRCQIFSGNSKSYNERSYHQIGHWYQHCGMAWDRDGTTTAKDSWYHWVLKCRSTELGFFMKDDKISRHTTHEETEKDHKHETGEIGNKIIWRCVRHERMNEIQLFKTPAQ